MPSTRVQAEGLTLDLDRRFFTPPSKAELDVAEWVKIEILNSLE